MDHIVGHQNVIWAYLHYVTYVGEMLTMNQLLIICAMLTGMY